MFRNADPATAPIAGCYGAIARPYPGAMATPPPGWYPSPDNGAWLRYWDGRQWTGHLAPAVVATPADDRPALAPSGLRGVEAVMTEPFAVIRGAWWPILAIGLIVWGLWTLAAVALAGLVNVGGWSSALWAAIEASDSYPLGLPPEVSADLEQQFSAAAQATSTATWIAAGIAFFAVTGFAAATQAAAVYRLAAEAGAGRPVTFATALAGVRTGLLRLLGYGLLLTAVWAIALGVIIGAAMQAGDHSAAAVLLGMLAVGALLFALCWAGIRVLPGFVQACVPGSSHRLRWSWNATRGRFWAIVGRLLLWAVLILTVNNFVSSLIAVPVGFAVAAAFISGGPGGGWIIVIAILGTAGLTNVLNGFGFLGVVPVWRDLSSDPAYRAIDEDGSVLVRR